MKKFNLENALIDWKDSLLNVFVFVFALALASIALTNIAVAQVNSISPTVNSLQVATGGTVVMTAAPAPAVAAATGTGNRVALADVCSGLIAGGATGVSAASTCAPGSVLMQVNVGAAPNSAAAQTFNASFTSAQLAGFTPTLVLAGQPYGSRRFYIVTQFVASALAPFSATRFTTVQVNLIEPPLPVNGITAAAPAMFDVSPNTATPISIRYTLAGADAPQTGQFCSALNMAYPIQGIANSNPCVGTVFGAAGSAIGFIAPPAYPAQAFEQLNVPETLSRQAVQQIRAGSGSGVFYFVRQFASGKWAVVQLRPNAMAAQSVLSFADIRIGFKDGGSLQNIGFFKRGQVMPAVQAALRYQGAGMLRARWEVVLPSDEMPSNFDLQSEVNLTSLERAQQRRYRVLDRVNMYLPAVGQAVLIGPPSKLLPNEQYGQYLVMLRIEGSESLSGERGGIASFALPMLRYYVGETSGPNGQPSAVRQEPQAITLLFPPAGDVLQTANPAVFEWQELRSVGLYRLEISANGQTIYGARVKPNTTQNQIQGNIRFNLPSFISSQLKEKAVRWRVVALGNDGQLVGTSVWRDLEVQITP